VKIGPYYWLIFEEYYFKGQISQVVIDFWVYFRKRKGGSEIFIDPSRYSPRCPRTETKTVGNFHVLRINIEGGYQPRYWNELRAHSSETFKNEGNLLCACGTGMIVWLCQCCTYWIVSCNESVSGNTLSKCTRQGLWWVWSFLPSSSRRLKSSIHLVRLVHFFKKKNSPFFEQ